MPPVPIPQTLDPLAAVTVELQMARRSTLEIPTPFPYPDPIPEADLPPVALTHELDMQMIPIDDSASDPKASAHPPPIPQQWCHKPPAKAVEFQIVRRSIRDVPPLEAYPVPIPEPDPCDDEPLASTYDVEMETIPIDE
jgi:hypothetical protein